MAVFFDLKKELVKLKIDYFILPNTDQYFNEYLSEDCQKVKLITRFTGSNAFLVINSKEQQKSAFFTDGRYTTQAQREIDEELFTIYNLSDYKPEKWLLEKLSLNQKIGFDPELYSISQIRLYQNKMAENLVALKPNPIDLILPKIEFEANKIFWHQLKYSGLSSAHKIKEITSQFSKRSEILILNSPPSIFWLLNLRAMSNNYIPIAPCRAIIYQNQQIDLFVDGKMIDQETKKYLETIKVEIFDPKFLASKLAQFKKKTISLDPESTNYWIYQQIKNENKIIEEADPCLLPKACKNKIEIKGAFKAHEIDGLAVTKFLFWLEKSIKKKEVIDEISAAEKLLEIRKQSQDFLFPSFETISAFGANGAVIHYHATKKTNKRLLGNSLYLIDSGGQYYFGTTDITRTVAIGKASKKIKQDFTNVLKGHLAIVMAKFPIGTRGSNLDSLARYYLWQNGQNYDHGTGHGVGSFLSVHEGPQSISGRFNSCSLQLGMILSNEPGYYKVNEYGIRIENLILVQKSSHKGFLEFENLSLAPIDHRLIDFAMLNDCEKKWLMDYHAQIYDKFRLKLNKEEKKWLKMMANFYIKKAV